MSDSNSPVQPVPPVANAANASTRAWEVLCHLSAIAGLIGIPFGNILGPLIVWLVKRQDSPAVDAHGKESLNFHISWTIYGIVLGAVIFVLSFVLVGFLLIPILFLGWLAMVILVVIGSIKASNGEIYRYPLTIRFLN